ncbi:PH (Pleckstrin Homology) domain-containing protein [Kineococcus xinjiangensis]|uniref:PH (Pleckstrin Homology) domain-containing protein n=2 Tax=Kineococcus xinjiangensis TaxID=512762 RepID=A0A2S6ICB0_9ACTN|nr:PH (Pleckstrin Homology) domain-containing protein [Kineococcus xinjiangensis]
MGVGAACTIIVAAAMWYRESLSLGGPLIISLGMIVQGLLRRRAHVALSPEGLVIYDGTPWKRRLPWRSVEHVRLDPSGGPRLLHVTCARGRVITLPELSADDSQRVMRAHSNRARGAADR